MSWALLTDHSVVVGLLLIAASIGANRFFATLRASFSVEPELYAPGETVKGTVVTAKRPDSVKAVLELRRDDDGRATRSAPAAVGEPVEDADGWRTPVAAALPLDARPDFEGGWVLAIEAVVSGRPVRAGDDVDLRDFWLVPPGPRAPGAKLRAELRTEEKPGELKAALKLLDGEGETLRSVPARVSEPETLGGGWRAFVEAELPADAKTREENAWVLSVSDDADVTEEEAVELRAV